MKLGTRPISFRMRHHAEHIAALADDAGDRMRRAVDIGIFVDYAIRRTIAVEHPPVAFEALERFFISLVIAFAMCDRHADDLTRIVTARERRIGALDPQMNILANEFQPRIAHEHAGQESSFAKDLKAVADAEHEAAFGGEIAHRIHHRRARCDRATA